VGPWNSGQIDLPSDPATAVLMTNEEEVFLADTATDLLLGGADSDVDQLSRRQIEERKARLVRASISAQRFQAQSSNWGMEVLRPMPPGGF